MHAIIITKDDAMEKVFEELAGSPRITSNHYQLLQQFLEYATKDCRICKSHISVYLAVFHQWVLRGFPSAVNLYCRDIMPVAKISSKATYHRIIKELHLYGYICYRPSYYGKRASEIKLQV